MKKFVHSQMSPEFGEDGELISGKFWRENIDEDEIDSPGPSVLITPKIEDEEVKIKVLMECWASLGTDLMQSLSLTMKDYNGNITKDEMLDKFTYSFKSLSDYVGYFLNCTSWHDQKLHSFDKDELNKRIERIKF